MDTRELLQKAIDSHASDIFIVAGLPASMRMNNTMNLNTGDRLLPKDTFEIVKNIYELAGSRSMDQLMDPRCLQIPCQRIQAERLPVGSHPGHHL